MDNMCKKLIEIGVEFEEYNYQMLHKDQGGADDCVSSGVLRNVDGTYLSNARLEEVMAVAKKKTPIWSFVQMQKQYRDGC